MSYNNPAAQQQALYAAQQAQQRAAPPNGAAALAMNPQQLAATVATLQHRAQQALAQGNQQAAQAVGLQIQQLQAMQRQHAQAAAVQTGAAMSGVSTREREMGDGDDQLRNAKRRKPTSRVLPSTTFTPSLPPSTSLGPTDAKLADSLSNLDSLAANYKKLQDLERKVDWTISRKKIEVSDAAMAMGGGRGRHVRRSSSIVTRTLAFALKRTLRVHLTATLHDQPFQLTPSDLEVAGKDVPADPATAGDISVGGAVKKEDEAETKQENGAAADGGQKEPKVPRVELKISGEVLDDPSHTQPLSQYLHRLVLDFPASDPAVLPQTSQPVSWTRSASTALPATFTSVHPTSTSLPVLDMRESDRVGVVEAVWGYAKDRGLVVGAEEGGSGMRGGFKVDERLKKIFGQTPLVQFHLVPEYLNRCLAPAQPRTLNMTVDVSPTAATEQHFAFDLPLYVPSPLTAALSSANTTLTTLTSPATSEARELVALDEKLALNCLSVAQRQQQLHLLMAFSRDPAGFLAQWVDSQAGSLNDVLSSTASGGGREGPAWREELRRSDALEGEWVAEAARVLGMREAEGRRDRLKQEEIVAVRQQHAQQQLAQQALQQQQYLQQQQAAYARR
ncbi:SWI/SNF and RSC complex subunit Ssr3 [Rhodosporidiobolus nylandii]